MFAASRFCFMYWSSIYCNTRIYSLWYAPATLDVLLIRLFLAPMLCYFGNLSWFREFREKLKAVTESYYYWCWAVRDYKGYTFADTGRLSLLLIRVFCDVLDVTLLSSNYLDYTTGGFEDYGLRLKTFGFSSTWSYMGPIIFYFDAELFLFKLNFEL